MNVPNLHIVKKELHPYILWHENTISLLFLFYDINNLEYKTEDVVNISIGVC